MQVQLLSGAPILYNANMKFYCDNKRHLVCVPYSRDNLHKMAETLCIRRCWFHGSHYDIPKRRINEIQAECDIISSKDICRIIDDKLQEFTRSDSSTG